MKFKKEIVAFTIYDYLKILPYLDQVNEIFVKKGIKKKDEKYNTKEENVKEFYETANSLLEGNISKEEKELVRKIVADYENDKEHKQSKKVIHEIFHRKWYNIIVINNESKIKKD